MHTSHRSKITLIGVSTVCILLALSAVAFAQDATCRNTETQAECHARLKCKPYEELEDCQKRLKGGQGSNGGNQGGGGGGDRGGGRGDDSGRGGGNDGGGDRGGSDDGDRGRRRGRGDDGGGGGGGGGRRRGSRSRSTAFEANKKFGVGLELGEPTGINAKVFLSPAGALDFGVGWIYEHYYYGDGLHLYVDYLAHPVSLASNPTFELPLYIGGGLRYWDFNYCYQGLCDYGGSAIGIRVPIGISFDFNNVPLDIFLQLAPVIDFTRGNYYDRYRDRSHFGIDLSLGIRFWLK